MSDLLDIAVGVVSQSVRRAEVAAHNIANVSTPGFQGRSSFSELLDGDPRQLPRLLSVTQVAPGLLLETGVPTDLAIVGRGYFVLEGSNGPIFTRSGRFERSPDGRLVGLGGLPVQAEAGGDIVLDDSAFEVASDGTVLQEGAPVARLAIVGFQDPAKLEPALPGGLYPGSQTPEDIDAPAVRQGALEASNVSLTSEMVVLMDSIRRAEAGQRIVSVYDDLMGRVISSFGQVG